MPVKQRKRAHAKAVSSAIQPPTNDMLLSAAQVSEPVSNVNNTNKRIKYDKQTSTPPLKHWLENTEPDSYISDACKELFGLHRTCFNPRYTDQYAWSDRVVNRMLQDAMLGDCEICSCSTSKPTNNIRDRRPLDDAALSETSTTTATSAGIESDDNFKTDDGLKSDDENYVPSELVEHKESLARHMRLADKQIAQERYYRVVCPQHLCSRPSLLNFDSHRIKQWIKICMFPYMFGYGHPKFQCHCKSAVVVKLDSCNMTEFGLKDTGTYTIGRDKAVFVIKKQIHTIVKELYTKLKSYQTAIVK